MYLHIGAQLTLIHHVYTYFNNCMAVKTAYLCEHVYEEVSCKRFSVNYHKPCVKIRKKFVPLHPN